MDLIDFHKMRTAVRDYAERGSAEAVLAVERSLWSSLVSAGTFADVEVGHTDDPDRLVIAMCRFPGQLAVQEVAGTFERLWLDRLRYPFWEAHTVLVSRGQVELEGVTRRSATGHYVSLHVLAQQTPIPAQRAPRPSGRPAVAPAT